MLEQWIIDQLTPLKGEKLVILADPQRMIRAGAQAVDGWAKEHNFTVLFCSGNAEPDDIDRDPLRRTEINATYSPKVQSIWKVQAIDFSGKKDMNWFDKPGTLMERLYYADCYWRGMPADDTPMWEVLLYPSIYIDERVQSSRRRLRFQSLSDSI